VFCGCGYVAVFVFAVFVDAARSHSARCVVMMERVPKNVQRASKMMTIAR
jgi:hypothetical protein